MAGKKKFIVILLIATILLFVAGISFLVILMTLPEPPDKEIKMAIEALSNASSGQARVYSPELYSKAEAAFDSAMAIWKRENTKIIFLRNYDEVTGYARLAQQKANEAAINSEKNSKNLKERIRQKISSLEKTNAEITRIFLGFPISNEIRSRLSRGRMLLKEAEIAFRNNQLLKANIKISDAEYLLESIYEKLITDIREYFKSFPDWQKWLNNSINTSRKNKSYLILVDKYAHKCYLYYAGSKKYEFDADLGRNWAEDKKIAGDRVTPEGMYKIIAKYQGSATKYYKALKLDYPNEEDIERFKKAILDGIIPPSSKPGDGIEIHGDGGKGTDWTDGCIALRNADMDKLFPFVTTGTPVIIIGSEKRLDEILNNK